MELVSIGHASGTSVTLVAIAVVVVALIVLRFVIKLAIVTAIIIALILAGAAAYGTYLSHLHL